MTLNACWVDENNDPTYDAFRRNGVTTVCRSLRDPKTTPAALAADRKQGFDVALYIVSSWYPQLDGPGFAQEASFLLTRIAPRTTGTPRVCLDMETHDVSYLEAALDTWRSLRPKRVTDWTLEGFQGGLFSRMFCSHVNYLWINVVPQFYTGSMAPLAADQVVLDLIARRFSPDLLMGFYDAAHLPERWNGYAFTQGRLP